MKSGCLGFILGLILLLLIDGILWVQIRTYLQQKWQKVTYLFQALFFISLLGLFQFSVGRIQHPSGYFWLQSVIGLLVLSYSPKLIFILFHGIALLFSKRRERFSILLRIIGGGCSIALFFFLLYSFTAGRYHYKLERITLPIQKLPTVFQGFTIVQLSDLHLGSLSQNDPMLPRLVKEVNQLHPDLIVFTGDMVNNFASELQPWIATLQKLKARYGKYAITGNHDYGDYSRWPTAEEKQKNVNRFFEYMETAGFHLLNNSHTPIVIQHDTLWLAGVENWGKPPFPRYGNLNKALSGIPENQTIILLTHDPSHWRSEVIHHPISLTLSGHTHAMQLGFEIGNFTWSPAKYLYPEYDGLYQTDQQFLYVSRGQGYLGLPGRIGLKPVITLFTLTP